MNALIAPILWILDRLRGLHQSRRRLQVMVHRGVFLGHGSPIYYFVKATNLSDSRDVEITHVWFATNPPVHLLIPERPLPSRLRPDETWEGWIDVSLLSHPNAERLCRVQLSTGTVVKSRLNSKVPQVGFVAGGGNR